MSSSVGQHIVNFNKSFETWGIELPKEAVENQQRGKIVKRGWTIWYLFGRDEAGDYLDYYASHRMTNDRHVRLYADGSSKVLNSYWSMRIVSDDPEENRRLENEFWEHNERVSLELESKGFGLQGDEHPSTIINRVLTSSRESHRRVTKESDSED
ncbi:MAG: hypothetical protein OXF23_00800 [Candidatus Dadabacteria bacterium]|nr:hypothetical protein [Candidatus Dadabacteria bacterium]